MERISVGDLRWHAGRYLARVTGGETVEVTEGGRVIALLVPPTPGLEGRERLIAEGRLIPAAAPFRIPSSRIASALSIKETLDDLRDNR